MLGWLNDSGNIILVNDNGGAGLLSKVEGIVPASGQFHLAVTAYDDFSLEGLHFESGTYTMSLDADVIIPGPTSIVLMGCGLLGLLGIGIRQRRKAK